ncbi:MAG: hypothetical protein HC822_03210 [Oscillochloris sp.]|nr:hypothetical protein [Oscillochloris sp.]
METIWLGYDGLALPFAQISVVLIYRPALDAYIVQTYGSVPRGVRSVVITADGIYWPARVPPEQLRRRWAAWRRGEE